MLRIYSFDDGVYKRSAQPRGSWRREVYHLPELHPYTTTNLEHHGALSIGATCGGSAISRHIEKNGGVIEVCDSVDGYQWNSRHRPRTFNEIDHTAKEDVEVDRKGTFAANTTTTKASVIISTDAGKVELPFTLSDDDGWGTKIYAMIHDEELNLMSSIAGRYTALGYHDKVKPHHVVRMWIMTHRYDISEHQVYVRKIRIERSKLHLYTPIFGGGKTYLFNQRPEEEVKKASGYYSACVYSTNLKGTGMTKRGINGSYRNGY